MTANPFIGSWALVSSVFKGEDGAIHHPFGEQVLGRINYEANGAMAAQLYSTTRATFASEDLAQGSDREIRTAFINMLCYFGRYQIDEDKQRVVHLVEGIHFLTGKAADRCVFIVSATINSHYAPRRCNWAAVCRLVSWCGKGSRL